MDSVCYLFLTLLGIEMGYTSRISINTSSTTNCALSSTVHFHIPAPISEIWIVNRYHNNNIVF